MLLALLLGGVLFIGLQIDAPPDQGPPPPAADAEQIARGAYLAKIGNCEGCHTRTGGVPYAGGRPIQTPFGVIHSSNLTPDADTGIGSLVARGVPTARCATAAHATAGCCTPPFRISTRPG